MNAEKRTLDYHIPYLGTDKEEYYLVFDEEVELENMSELFKKVENEYASYEMKITQMKPNMIRIQSIYTVKKLFIAKDQVLKLDEVNQAYKDVRDAKFVFKTKRA